MIHPLQLTYLGPPFNEKDFSPPRPNSTALSLPSAATRLELWHGLENQARLAQNQRAYSVLLAAVRELARSTLCPTLRTSLLHFCTGLDGLLGSISALMTTLGYTLPPASAKLGGDGNLGELRSLQLGTGGDRPAPLMSPDLYRSRGGTRTEHGERNNQRQRGEREGGLTMGTTERRGRAGRRVEAAGGRSGGSREKGKGQRGRRGKREDPASWKWAPSKGKRVEEEEEEEDQELEQVGVTERWGRRLLSVSRDAEEGERQPEPTISVSYVGSTNQYSYNLDSLHTDTLRREDGLIGDAGRSFLVGDKPADVEGMVSLSSTAHHQRRPPRSVLPSTPQPPPSTFSLLYQVGAGEAHTLRPRPVTLALQRGTSLLPPPLAPLLSSTSSSPSSLLLSVQPTMNEFARKVEGFWILRELQSWLWRSAKDFNRLKRRLRG